MTAPELHRPVNLDHVGPSGLDVMVDASSAECAALAERMQIPAVHTMRCTFHLVREDRDHFAATGRLRARITQTCIVSAEEFETEVDEAFRVRFVPAGEESEVIEPEADDDLPYEGNTIDFGEVATEQLALAIDPYPRMPGAELPDEAADDGAEAPPHPFESLARLRRLN